MWLPWWLPQRKLPPSATLCCSSALLQLPSASHAGVAVTPLRSELGPRCWQDRERQISKSVFHSHACRWWAGEEEGQHLPLLPPLIALFRWKRVRWKVFHEFEVNLTLEQDYSAFWQCLDPFMTQPRYILFPWREQLQPGLSPDPMAQAGLRMGAGSDSMASLQPAPSPCSSASPICFIRLPVFYWHGGVVLVFVV